MIQRKAIVTDNERDFLIQAANALNNGVVNPKVFDAIVKEAERISGHCGPCDIPAKAMAALAEYRKHAKPLAEIESERGRVLERLHELESRRVETIEKRNAAYNALMAALTE